MDLYTNRFYKITTIIYKVLILNLMFIGYCFKGFLLYGINPSLVALVNACSKEKLKNMEVEELKCEFAEIYEYYKVTSISTWGITLLLATLYAIIFFINHSQLNKITATILLGTIYVFGMIIVGLLVYSYFLCKGNSIEDSYNLMLKSFVDRPLKFIFLAIILITVNGMFFKNLFLVVTIVFPIIIVMVREYIERILIL